MRVDLLCPHAIKLMKHMELVKEHWISIVEIKAGLADGGDFDLAVETWYSLPDEVQIGLWTVAPTKGGIFTTEERSRLRSPEASAIQLRFKTESV